MRASVGRLNKANSQNVKMQNFQIISKTAQVVVKSFWPQTNITKELLFSLGIAESQSAKMQNFQIISKTTQAVIKPFKPRTNIPKMFLSPSSKMVIVFPTLKKSTFLVGQPIFGPVYKALRLANRHFLHERP